MSCDGSPGCDCGCCAGIAVLTPQGESNPPGLPSIAYRTGTWASFRESMLARLSSSDYPALAGLTTRSTDDFSIALLDASAVMLDILTFYQERLANESYLRTATQLDSLTQLSRLIGYRPGPGVAASTYLAFTVKAATGLPADPTLTGTTIPAGTQAQSIPAQGQTPQTFETSADILAKSDWNALPVLTGKPWEPQAGATSVYLAGTATQLQPGDAILIVGDERVQNPESTRWDLRSVSSVEVDSANGRTCVTWSEGLGADGSPSSREPKLHALRQRAALFGYNALAPTLLAKRTLASLAAEGLVSGTEWAFGVDHRTGSLFAGEAIVDLDLVYSKLVPGGWLALIAPDSNTSRTPSGFASLYRLASVSAVSRSDYGSTTKVSRVTTDRTTELETYYGSLRSTIALTESEELPAVEQPLDYPLYGTYVDLGVVRSDLAGITAVAVIGKSQKLSANAAGLMFVPDDGSDAVPLAAGDIVSLRRPPADLTSVGTIPEWTTSNSSLRLSVADGNGRSGTVEAALSDFSLVLATQQDPVVQEFALVQGVSVEADPFPHTRILLRNPLVNCYDRTATTVNANVGPASAGRSVGDVLGSGSAAATDQQFNLSQSPLTYVEAPTPSGSSSTLEVRADGVAWSEVPSLYAQGPAEQVFATLNLPGGKTEVRFGGDGEGAALPSGQHNLQASYRIGLGSAGNVLAGAIATLIDRPPGVTGVSNPLPATGGQDADSSDEIRAKAPSSVLTLGRAVSVPDYQNLAASFAGIAKASATWIPAGPYRGVLLTVAGAGGAALPPGNPTLGNLITALRSYGNPSVAVFAQSFLETTFRLSADLRYDPAYDASAVQASVRALLTTTYSFASRTFGQGVSIDELEALIQGVPGVVANNVTLLEVVATSTAGDIGSVAYSVSAYNDWLAGALTQTLPRPCGSSLPNIGGFVPVVRANELPLPAEILVLDPDPKKLVLGERA